MEKITPVKIEKVTNSLGYTYHRVYWDANPLHYVLAYGEQDELAAYKWSQGQYAQDWMRIFMKRKKITPVNP